MLHVLHVLHSNPDARSRRISPIPLPHKHLGKPAPRRQPHFSCNTIGAPLAIHPCLPFCVTRYIPAHYRKNIRHNAAKITRKELCFFVAICNIASGEVITAIDGEELGVEKREAGRQAAEGSKWKVGRLDREKALHAPKRWASDQCGALLATNYLRLFRQRAQLANRPASSIASVRSSGSLRGKFMERRANFICPSTQRCTQPESNEPSKRERAAVNVPERQTNFQARIPPLLHL